jgi:cation diffusion facilitator family transporter
LKRPEFRLILISLLVSLLITGLKFYAYWTTQSVAILSDALESIINVMAGAFACYSIYLTNKPKDDNHPYGHGKVEFFSIGFEGAMIFIAGILIIYKAISYIWNPYPLQQLDTGSHLIAMTLVLNLALAWMLIRAGKRIPSITLTGNGQHILTDVYTSIGLIIALILIQITQFSWLDPVMSLLVALLILRKGYQLMRTSISALMDETDLKIVDDLVHIVNTYRKPTWIDIHNMRVQQYGNDYHIDCHITLPYYMQLDEAHAQITNLQEIIDLELKGHATEFFMHADPCIPSCCQYCQLDQCPVRKHPFLAKIEWTRDNILPNRRHG